MGKELCVVVGMGPGIGLAVARRFGKEGFQVAMLARRPQALAEYSKELGEEGIEAKGYAADASRPESLIEAFNKLKAELGEPSVLVYNAAALRESLGSTLAPETLAQDLSINVVGALVAAQQVLPGMRARGNGTILMTGGGLALQPYAQYTSLGIGKAAMRSLALNLAQEVQKDGVHVGTVTVCGFVRPETHFAPELIAESYWKLYRQAPEQWETEVVYQ